MAELQVRRGQDRFLSSSPGVRTRHSFSFGPHYDPGNTGFGPLVLHDEHRLEPGAGFPRHPHRGLEVVSWVLDGVLVHEDDAGRARELGPGSLQHLSTGGGTVHAERAGNAPTRFVQAWLLADRPEAAPSYAVLVPELDRLAPVLRVGGAVLHVGRLPGGTAQRLPAGQLRHVFVARGSVQLGDVGALGAGDAVRVTGPGEVELRASEDAELLVWEMQVTWPVA